MTRLFTIGDIHGRYEALVQVLKASNFNYEIDTLIVLGDVVDGGKDTYKCVEELLKIKNIVFIKGNHDSWWIKHLATSWDGNIWLHQGGANTLRSYGAKVQVFDDITEPCIIDSSNFNVPCTHQDFFNKAIPYYVLDDMVFVHGGFNPKIPLKNQKEYDLLWDRNLIMTAIKKPIINCETGQSWKKIFVGHTTTQQFGNWVHIPDCLVPLKFNNLIMMDTGAGWSGRLSIMNVETEEYWVSDIQIPCHE